MALAGFLTIVANVVSVILFPAAVLGSQNSVLLLLRFAVGHAFAVMMASAFGFWLVFAVAGVLLAVLPATISRSVSLAARFAIGIAFLALVGTVFSVSRFALDPTHYRAALWPALWPPFCFLGLARTVWGRGAEPLVEKMAMASFASLAS